MGELMMKKLFVFLFLILFPNMCLGATYWVHPTDNGSTWNAAGCQSVADPGAGKYCTLSLANLNLIAGDTVYIKGGTYNVPPMSHFGTNGPNNKICPKNSGTFGSPITYAAAPSEEPIFLGVLGADHRAVEFYLPSGHPDYIVVDGMTIVDCYASVCVQGGSAYCEIKNNTIYHTAPTDQVIWGIDFNGSAHHNWIHHNTVRDMIAIRHAGCLDAKDEGWADGIKIGSITDNSNFNTIENNTVYHFGHTTTDSFGFYNVWRNNVLHNEGFYDSGFIFGTATGGNSSSCTDAGTHFSGVVGWSIYVVQPPTPQEWAIATITSISADSHTVYFTAGSYTPIFGNGVGYAIGNCIRAPDPTGWYPGNGKFAHRAAGISGDYIGGTATYDLIEGNRIGYGSSNPRNSGAEALSISTQKAKVRYNDLFGSDGAGLLLKSAFQPMARYNKVYNNTIYGNGRYVTSQSGSWAIPRRVGVEQYSSGAYQNYLYNNIIYNNGNIYASTTGGTCGGSPCMPNHGVYYGTIADQYWGSNLCDITDSGLGCIAGDPLLSDVTLFDFVNVATKPNFSLSTSSSPARDAGTHLTTVHTNDSGSGIRLYVNDSTYFQAGSEPVCGSVTKTSSGSCLSNVQADWICVGNVSNCVQIVDISYTASPNWIDLSNTVDRLDNDKIWLYKKSDGVQVLYGSAPDIGAHEYFAQSTAQGCEMSGTEFK